MKWAGAQVKRGQAEYMREPVPIMRALTSRTGFAKTGVDGNGLDVAVMSTLQHVRRSVACLVLMLPAGACVTGGGEPAVGVAMPSDTYETCRGAGAALSEGVNFLSSSGPQSVSLGMSECELMQVLGEPASVAPGPAPAGGRHVVMTYANPDGTSTSYTFVNNALKEMNLVSGAPAALPPGAVAPDTAPPG